MFHARLCGLMVKTPPSALLFQYLSTQTKLGGNAGSNPATGISDTCNTCRLAWAKPPPSDALAVACVTNPILGSNARSTVGLCGLMVKTPPSVLLFLRNRFRRQCRFKSCHGYFRHMQYVQACVGQAASIGCICCRLCDQSNLRKRCAFKCKPVWSNGQDSSIGALVSSKQI